ncbi:hypothetical protein M8J75_002662 [Diaphorina citri]|nr:hypothetical protein M8J75_002662 [Diaphorina citri]
MSFDTTKLREVRAKNAYESSILSRCPENYEDLDAESQWNTMKSAVIDSATTVLGKKPTTRWDWFDDSKTEILDTLEKKKEAHLNRVRNPSQANEEAYNKARLTSHLRHKHPGEPPPGLRPQKLLPAQTAPPTTPVLSLVAPAHPVPSAPTPAPAAPPTPANLSGFTCERCGRVCASRAGLISHSRGKSCRGQSLERGGNAGTTNA